GRMKKPIPKIVLRPHYIGGEQRVKLFKRVLTDEIQRKLKVQDNSTNNYKKPLEKIGRSVYNDSDVNYTRLSFLKGVNYGTT
ncbi:MAG: hypothetical protein NC401_16245, partial [Ruminococcus sp.]|nr:hypothetical protein [Ruminococcus sp.]